LNKAHKSIRCALIDELNLKGVLLSGLSLPIFGKMMIESGEIAQSELQDFLELDRHRVSRLVRDLEVAQYINIEINPSNKRENILVFTEAGKELAVLIELTANEIIERAYQGISKEARLITEQTLNQITTNLNTEYNEVG
jgi:DNA-binding MarR family transcriptional regulator